MYTQRIAEFRFSVIAFLQSLNELGDEWLEQLESAMDNFYKITGRQPVYTVCFC